MIDIPGAMEIGRAALGDDRNLRAGRAAVLGLIVRGKHPEFLDRVETNRGKLVAVVSGVHIADSVQSQVVLILPGAVGGDRSDTAMSGCLQIGISGNARCQSNKRQVAAPINGDALDLLAVKRLRALAAFGLQLHGGGGYFDRLRYLTDFQNQLADRDLLIAVYRQVLLFELFEALGFNRDVVGAWLRLREHKPALRICNGVESEI